MQDDPKVESEVSAPPNLKGDIPDSTKRPNNRTTGHRSSKKARKENRTNYSRRGNSDDREEEGYVRNFGSAKTQVHAGSYANPAMRELFGVTLPSHLIPPLVPPIGSNNVDDDDEKVEGESRRHFSKRKVAFLLAYIGTGYSGFQSNEGQRTLQAEFELALLKGELINPRNMGFFHKYGWSTSGRTDKGVHACAQVCSAKIQLLPDQTLENVRELLNRHLSEQQFRVLDVVRTSKSFCAKTGRSRVRYQYMIPAFWFMDRRELREWMLQAAPLDREGRTPGGPLSGDELAAIKERVQNYRVRPEHLDGLQEALRKYEGTHSFHNFTNKLTAKDANATRYIISFNVEPPMTFDNGMQWVPTQVIGQSFLIHQIRKMVSVAMDSVRMVLPDLIPFALSKEAKIRTDLAPAQGLFMEMSFYDGYNQKILPQSDLKELKWHSEGTEVFDRWKKFRNEVIMDHIVKEEHREGNFLQHLYNHEFYCDLEAFYQMKNEDGKTMETGAKVES